MMDLAKIEAYCSDILKGLSAKEYPFHNFMHTRNVVEHVKEIAEQESVSKSNVEILTAAAWFHDVGYSVVREGHEEESARIAFEYLTSVNCNFEAIEGIVSCIRATSIPQKPNSKLAQILCDADLYHLGSCDYFYWQHLLRMEWEGFQQKNYNDYEWFLTNRKFFLKHNFFTSYCRQNLALQKERNLKRIDAMLLLYR